MNSSHGPDGASAWAVAFAVCMINFIMAGLGRMSGILYVAFIELFKVDRKMASTPFSIRSSTRNLLGPIVGILGQKYGIRKVAVIGGILSTVSATSCFFASDMFWITILWGIFNGIGSSLVVTLPQVTIGQYFKKYHSTASGMAFSGGCIGSLVFPGVLDLLLYHYGLGGTFLFIAAIIMHTIPAAMILRKPHWLKKKTTKTCEEGTSDALKKALFKEPTAEKESKSVVKSGKQKDTAVKDKTTINLQYLQQNRELVVKMLSMKDLKTNISALLDVDQEKFQTTLSEVLEELFDPSIDKYRTLTLAKNDLISNKLQNDSYGISSPIKSGYYSSYHLNVVGSIRNRSMPNLSKISSSLTHSYILGMIKEVLSVNPNEISSCFPGENPEKIVKTLKELKRFHKSKSDFTTPTFQTPVKTPVKPTPSDPLLLKKQQQGTSIKSLLMTALRLHTRPIFLLICLCRVVHFVAFIPVLTTVVDFVIDKGMKEEAGKWAIAALSVGDLMGRLCFGWVTDKQFLTVPKFMMTVMIAQGLSTISLPMMDTKLTLFLMLGLFGMLQGSLLIRHPILVLRYTQSHEQAIAMGCTNFFSGLLGIALPLYIGYFRDTLGTYNYIFYINGIVGALVGLMWSLEPYFVKCSSTEPAKNLQTV